MAMGIHPNLFFRFRGALRPEAKEPDEIIWLDLVQDQRAIDLKVQVDWWEDLPYGQEIHGTTTYCNIKYDVTIVIQSSPVEGYSISPIDSDYVKLVHHV